MNDNKNDEFLGRFLCRGFMFSQTCQWPINEPGTIKFKFCRKQVFDKKPYCMEHCELAYRKKNQDKTSSERNAKSVAEPDKE